MNVLNTKMILLCFKKFSEIIIFIAVSSKFCISFAEGLSSIYFVSLLDSNNGVVREREDGVADKEGTIDKDTHDISIFKASFPFFFFFHVLGNYKLRNGKFY